MMTSSPGLEKTTHWSLENCKKSIPKSWCSPIQGTISNFCLIMGQICPLVFTHFGTLSPGLEIIGTLECIPDSFPARLNGGMQSQPCKNEVHHDGAQKKDYTFIPK